METARILLTSYYFSAATIQTESLELKRIYHKFKRVQSAATANSMILGSTVSHSRTEEISFNRPLQHPFTLIAVSIAKLKKKSHLLQLIKVTQIARIAGSPSCSVGLTSFVLKSQFRLNQIRSSDSSECSRVPWDGKHTERLVLVQGFYRRSLGLAVCLETM